MTAPSDSEGSILASAASGLARQALQEVLPPEVQNLLKPGKTPDRIQHAINWAARRDPAVLAEHKARRHKVTTFEDIHNLPLDQLDSVARHFARKYRRRALLTGAVTGLPGGLWALVAASADVQLTAVYAVRMAAAVAQSYGYDTAIVDEQAHLAEVLALAAGIDSLRGIGNWLTREGLVHLLPELLPKMLLRLSVEITEEQAAKWVGRLVPGVGAAVGGAIDYTFLKVAGERAIAYYHNRYLVEHGLAPAEANPSLPARAFAAITPPQQASQPSAGQLPGQPVIVEGSLAAAQPAQLPPSGQPAPTQRPAAVAALPAPLPNKRKYRKAPERFGIYLAIFAVFVLGITIAACAALVIIVTQAVQSLVH